VEFANEVITEKLAKLENVTNVEKISASHYTVIATSDIRSSLFDFAIATNNKILMIKPIERSMEEVFKSLTK